MSSILDIQNKLLKKYIRYAANTDFGKRHGFGDIKSYHEYKEAVKLTTFYDYTVYREPMKRGIPDLTWPGSSHKFAISAGTTGKPKDIPITQDRERSDKLFLRRVALSYLRQNPNIFKLFGKQLSIPGTIEKDPDYP